MQARRSEWRALPVNELMVLALLTGQSVNATLKYVRFSMFL